jgi:DivIVA domain-containing protein
MSEERLRSITSSPHLVPEDVARHTFGSVRRGFDPNEVRAYLESLANALRSVGDREQQLAEELAAAERRAENPVLDEPTLTSALGTEMARVLHSAHEASAEMVAKAQAEADRLLAEGHAEIDQLRTATDAELMERTAESEAAAEALREHAEQQAAATADLARHEAEKLVSEAREQCLAMVDEAQGLRARVLADLSRRRKVLHAQIEQLRAGRERLAQTVHDVRQAVDDIAEDLFEAEDNARLAAELAAREAETRTEERSPEAEAAALLAEEAASSSGETGPLGIGGGLVDFDALPGSTPPSPAPAEDAPAAPTTAAADAGDEGDPSGSTVPEESVDALFAKLRAANTEAASTTEAAITSPSGELPSEDPPSKQTRPASAKKSPGRKKATAREAAVESGGEANAGSDGQDEEGAGPPDGRNPLEIQRDELIAPIVRSLSRRLKRTLQDSQNELLDSLRSNGSHWSNDLLPDLTEHVDAYATAAMPALEQAAEAGVAFAGIGKRRRPSADALAGVAHQLAEEVVGPLRRRLTDDSGLDGAEESVVADHVGSAFREWKGERIERLAGDYVVAGFSSGSMATASGVPAASVEWVAVAGSRDDPCPDCEDNGLTGKVKPGEAFPTGHVHPPAHPGCRCLLAISAT